MSNYDWSKPLFITGTTTSGILAGMFATTYSLVLSMPPSRLEAIMSTTKPTGNGSFIITMTPCPLSHLQNQPLTLSPSQQAA